MLIECPKCHGKATAPKYPGSGGCDTCMGNGVIEVDDLVQEMVDLLHEMVGDDPEKIEMWNKIKDEPYG